MDRAGQDESNKTRPLAAHFDRFHIQDEAAVLPDALTGVKRWMRMAIGHSDDKGKLDKCPAWRNPEDNKLYPLTANKPTNHKAYRRDHPGLFMSHEDSLITVDWDGHGQPDHQEWVAETKADGMKLGYSEFSLNDPDGDKGKVHVPLMGIVSVPLHTSGKQRGQPMNSVKCPELAIEIYFGNQAILWTGNGNKMPVMKSKDAQEYYAKIMAKIEEVTGKKFCYTMEDIEAMEEAKKAKDVQRATKTPTATTISTQHATNKEKKRGYEILKAFKEQNIPLCPDNQTFCEVGYPLAGLYGVDEANAILANEAGYDDKTLDSLMSMAKEGCDNPIARLIAYAKKRGVNVVRRATDSYMQTPLILHPLDVAACAEVVTEPVIDYLQPPSTTSAIVGPSGSMKTRFVIDRIRAVLAKIPGAGCVFISNDMPDGQIKWYLKGQGLATETETHPGLLALPVQDYLNLTLDLVFTAIDTWIKNNKIQTVAVILIDTVVSFCEQVWTSLGIKKEFHRTRCAASAHFSHTHILQPLADKFNACLIGIEHNSVNAANRDNFPGHSKWEGGFSASVMRIYRQNRTQSHKLPARINDVLKNLDEGWRFASDVGKNRFNRPDFLFRFDGKKMDYKWVEEVLDEHQSAAEPPVVINNEKYKELLIDDLKSNPNKMHSHGKLTQISDQHPPYSSWETTILKIAKELPSCVRERPGGRVTLLDDDQSIDAGLYYSYYNNNHLRVCFMN